MVPLTRAPDPVTLLRSHAVSAADRVAVTFVADPARPEDARSLTYAELDAEARRIASWLGARGEPGDRALLLHPVGLEFVTAFLGCLYAGVVAVPAPLPGRYRHERNRIRAIAGDAGVSVVLTDPANLAAVRDWAAEEGLTAAVPDLDGVGDASAWTPPDVDRTTVALLQYTSGSTGDPKGVVIDHGNLLHNAESIRLAYGLDETTTTGGWIPLFHDMGLMGQLLPALFLRSRCVLMSPTAFVRRPHLWLRLIDEYDLVFSAAPNFAYELCHRRVTDEQVAGLDLSRWRCAANGSEPVHADTLLAFARRFAPAGFRIDSLMPSYGMAEATVFVSTGGRELFRLVDPELMERREFRPADSGRKVVSCGVAQDLEVRVVDPETTAEAPPGRIGELWLRGPSVSPGYWNAPSATDAVFRARLAGDQSGARYLRTGDLGTVFDGELFVTGRIKEVLIVRGRNLYPQDVEQEVRAQHPRLAGSVGAAFVVPVPGQDALVLAHEVRGVTDEEDLRSLAAAIRQTVAKEFGAPVASVLLLRPGTVRRTTSGKIQRSAMRELFLGGELAPVVRLDAVDTAAALESLLRSRTGEPV